MATFSHFHILHWQCFRRRRLWVRPLFSASEGALCPFHARPLVPLVPCSLRSASEGAFGLFRPLFPALYERGRIWSLLARLSPERASRIQPGVSAALPPVIKARDSVYHASSARPAMLCGKHTGSAAAQPLTYLFIYLLLTYLGL